MLTMLAYLAGVGASFAGIEVLLLVLLIGPVQLHCTICLWRLYRIRRSEGKTTPLPGHWELRAELWDPLAWFDQLWVIVFCFVIVVSCTTLILLQKLSPPALFIAIPLSGFSGLSYVLACYRNPKL